MNYYYYIINAFSLTGGPKQRGDFDEHDDVEISYYTRVVNNENEWKK